MSPIELALPAVFDADWDPSTLITYIGADICRCLCASPLLAGSLTNLRSAPPIALVREQKSVTAQAGSASLFGPGVNGKEKKQLRNQARQKRRALDHQQRTEASARICQRIAASKSFRNARRIALYLPMDGEVDCLSLFETAMGAGKEIFLPQLPGRYPRAMNFALLDAQTALEPGPMGTIQPARGSRIAASAREMDLVITPLAAFDPRGNRIGMGAGYYDRTFGFLAYRKHWISPRLVGVAFECQKFPAVPIDPWDVPLWSVVTESGSYPVSKII